MTAQKNLCGAPGRYCAETSGYVALARCQHLMGNRGLSCARFSAPLQRQSAFSAINYPLKCDACVAAREGGRA